MSGRASSIDWAADDAELHLWLANILAPLREEALGYAKALNFQQSQHLKRLGIEPAGAMASRIVGVSQVDIDKADNWSPAQTGPFYITIAVSEREAITDIVAFSPDAPDQWYLRRGSSWALGLDEIAAVQSGWHGASLFISPTPLDWLRAGMRGACVIDWTRDAMDTLRSLSGIQVADRKFAQALRLQLSKPPRLPEINVFGGKRDAA